ncbi:MAG: DUF2145 domain-containing protein [Asticcacaulis sp.]|nr:DUF2145 domain-containing protein [Asticcacaulis sp.]
MRRLVPLLLAALLAATPAVAAEPGAGEPRPVPDSGGFSNATTKRHFTAPQAAAFAKQIEYDLAAKGVHVAIVFRTGRSRDNLPKGIAYTHGAFWVYGDIRGGDGKTYKGYAAYNLYQGDGETLPKDRSYLAQDFPIDFVSGSQADDVAVIIPSPEMQRRIAAVIASPGYDRLHVDDYSLVSNPFDARYQNCTEFVLDVVAAAAWQTSDYPQIKANLAAHFTPTVIHANVFERIFGPMVDPRLKMDDQDGEIVTATYESIAAFMKDNHLLAETYVLQKQN